MARPKSAKSTNSFSGLGLKPYEDTVLVKILKVKQLSFKTVARELFRKYMEENDTKYKRPVA